MNITQYEKVMQEKCPRMLHFNVPCDWFETNSWHQKCCSEGGKKICGCRGLLGRVICVCANDIKIVTIKNVQCNTEESP